MGCGNGGVGGETPTLHEHDTCFLGRLGTLLMQIEFHDMRVRLLNSLMATNDEEGEVQADAAVHECLGNMLNRNYDLHAGRDGIPGIRVQDAESVRTMTPTMLYSEMQPRVPACLHEDCVQLLPSPPCSKLSC